MAETKKKEFYRRAANGEGQIMSFSWTGEQPQAVVQLVHGVSEHSGRYADFAAALSAEGFAVYANDMAGHGLSKQGHRGAFAMQKGGLDALLEDIDALFAYAEAESGQLPRVLIGMGFGALLSGLYAAAYAGPDMLIAIAALAAPGAAAAIRINADHHIRRHGYNAVSESVHNMMYQLNKQTGSDLERQCFWLSTDELEQQRYMEDESCGFPLTSSGYREMLRAFKRLQSKQGIEAIPDIPIYLLSGSEDQLGGCGSAVTDCVTELTASGHHQVAYKLYRGFYHDILHDSCRGHVLDDVLTWMKANLRNA